nr:hypothetical protein [Tanacetum cinerariifolium]
MQRSRTAYRLPLPVTLEAAYVTYFHGVSPRQEYLLECISEYGISEDLYPELSGPEERIVDFTEDKVFPTVADWRVSAPKDEMPAEVTYSPEAVAVKIGTRPRAAHEVSLLNVTTSRVIEMKDLAATTDASGIPSTIERSPLDFANENPSQQSTGETGLVEEIVTMGPRMIKERHKRGNDGVDMNAPPKVLRKDHADSRPTQSTVEGKSLALTRLKTRSTFPVLTPRETPVDVSDPDPLSFANPQSIPKENVAQSSQEVVVAGDPESENTSFTSMVGSSERYFSKLRHLRNDNFLRQYNMNLTRKLAMGSQLRLRFEQEAKLLKKSVAQLARWDQRIQARKNGINNLKALLEAKTDMKKATDAKNAELVKELENLCALCTDLQVSNDRLSQQVSTLQAQVTGEEKIKAAFKEFKQYENNRVEKRCAEMDARLDALSIDFDEELYPHMLTAIAGRRWVIGHGLCLAVIKCGESTKLRQVFADVVSARIAKGMSEGLKYRVEHGKANLDLEAIEAYDPESTLNTGRPQWIRELSLSSSQLKIPVYPVVRDPKDPWSCKEEILLVDTIAANVSRAEKKKKCRVVCRTQGVGFAHHARSDGVPVSAPTVAP